MNNKIYYNDLTIDQKISLNEFIYSQKRREQIGIYEHSYFEGLHCLSILDRNFIGAINMYLST